MIINDVDTDTFTMEVFDNNIKVESWGQLTKNKNNKFYVESFINFASEWIKIEDNISVLDPPENGTYVLGDKRINGAICGCDGIPFDKSNQDVLFKDGLYSLLNNINDVDIIAIPGYFSNFITKSIIDVCEKKNCLAVIDPPMDLSLTSTIEQIENYKSNFVSMFWPWVEIYDSYNKRNKWVPPSGAAILSIIKFNPKLNDGMENPRNILIGILNLLNKPTKEELKLNNSINTITYNTNNNVFVINNQKTLLNGNINTRRTLLCVEKILYRTINNLTDHNLSIENLDDKISQVCEHVLGQIKSEYGIHNYTIEKMDTKTEKEYHTRIGIQLNDAFEIYIIDLLFH